ncbi:hypothetical protein DFAR_2450009 [Desulfarculales bacterium]
MSALGIICLFDERVGKPYRKESIPATLTLYIMESDMLKEVVIVGAARTAVGRFGGMYSDVPAVDLGVTALKEALKRGKVEPGQVDELIYGNVLNAGPGQNAAARGAGCRHPRGGGRFNHQGRAWDLKASCWRHKPSCAATAKSLWPAAPRI